MGSPIDTGFFGLHDAAGYSLDRLSPGSIRLWDVGLKWSEIEKYEDGNYDFSTFDALMTKFNAGGVGAPKVTYVLGQTPSLYAASPTDPPPLDKFDAYVRAVATRYAGKIDFYQVWNEANISHFFTGTQQDMAQLTKVAHDAVSASDPNALIIAPSGPVRLAGEQTWLGNYYACQVPGTSDQSWNYFDRVGFSMYPAIGDGPEAMLGLLGAMQVQMYNANVPFSKQVPHASEINYDVEGNTPPHLLADADQIAFTMRTYLVGAIAGFERMHWYRYDWGLQNGNYLANTYWTKPSDFTSLTPAGSAFNRIKAWMSGTYMGSSTDPFSGHSVKFGSRTIVWNAMAYTPVVPPRGMLVTHYDGTQFTASGFAYNVGKYPTMFG